MPKYDGSMVGGPWHGQLRELTPPAMQLGRFQPEEYEGEYVRDPVAPALWNWQPNEITVTASGSTHDKAVSAAAAKAHARYGCDPGDGEVVDELAGAQIDENQMPVGDPVAWTVRVRFGRAEV